METEFIAHYFEQGARAQSVREHLEETANLAESFAAKVGMPSTGRLAGLLHDAGKYSREFQVYIRSAEGMLDPDVEQVDAKELRGKIDHSTAGAQMVWESLKDDDFVSRLAAQATALCIASHHSGLMDCLSPNGDDKFSARMAKTKDKTHLEEVSRVADVEIMGRIARLLGSRQCVGELRGQLAELLSPNDSTEVREFYLGMLVRLLFSALIDADRLSSAGRGTANRPEWALLVERVERHISGMKRRNWVDDLRSEVSLACREFASREKGLYQLTVPTGGAKTLSSLRFALHHAGRHGMDRIFYVIPYTTIIDQNASVARLALEREGDSIILEHHSNLTPDRETWQNRLLSENWDATVVFTTNVQFLETLFGGSTQAVRRMHQLANAVIVFDEIQTLPVKTIHLFNNAVNFLVRQCGSTAVFCTATQPLLDSVSRERGAARLSAQPEMAPRPDRLFEDLRRVQVIDKRKTGGWTEPELAQCICDQAKEAASALAIVNTRAAARALYELCKQQTRNIYHLSANMCPAHRLEIVDDMKEKLDRENYGCQPLVCVSTQVIEAGVDVDFGSVVRYLAGLDSMAQAAGRCNRNGRRRAGEVLVVNPAHEDLTRLREIRVGKAAAVRVLDEYRKDPVSLGGDLLSPKAMRRYYQYYFFDRAHEMGYRVSSKQAGHDDDLLSLLSTNSLSVQEYIRGNQKSVPPNSLRQSFKTAGSVFEVIDAPTKGVIVPYGADGKRIIASLCASSNIDRTRQLLREAQRYSVNLYPRDLQKLTDLGGVHETQRESGMLYLDESYYSDETGVVFDEEPMTFLNA